MLAHRDDPIMAIATASGRGAVGVVRISGQDLKAYAQALSANFAAASCAFADVER